MDPRPHLAALMDAVGLHGAAGLLRISGPLTRGPLGSCLRAAIREASRRPLNGRKQLRSYVTAADLEFLTISPDARDALSPLKKGDPHSMPRPSHAYLLLVQYPEEINPDTKARHVAYRHDNYKTAVDDLAAVLSAPTTPGRPDPLWAIILREHDGNLEAFQMRAK